MILQNRLKQRGIVLLDGALGTELERRGVSAPPPLWSAAALQAQPDLVRTIHAEYAAAGADILVANTFRTNVRTLRAAGLFERGAELNRLAVELARDGRIRGSANVTSTAHRLETGATEAGATKTVAASIAPVEDCYRPDLVPDEDILLAEHCQMIVWLRAAGTELAWIETMGTIREARAAAQAAREANLSAAVSFILREDGALLGGEPLAAAVAAVEPFDPVLIGLNCIPPAGVEAHLPRLRRLTSRPLAVYAHINNAKPTPGWSYAQTLSPAEYAECAGRWIDLGADVIGGCCGTTPEYIRALKDQTSHIKRRRRFRRPAWTRTPWGRVVLLGAGLMLIMLGFLLGFVPFLPGFPLGIAGIMLLSLASRRVRDWLRGAAGYLPERLRRHLHFLQHQE